MKMSLQLSRPAGQASFPYGQLFDPEPDLREIWFGIPNTRAQMCVTESDLRNIAQHCPEVKLLRWDRRKYCHLGKARGLDISIFRWPRGWRVVRRFRDRTPEAGIPYDLCYAFTDRAVIFPTSSSAEAAAEIFSAGERWNVATMVWINDNGAWKFR
jgi:hypothetical protein